MHSPPALLLKPSWVCNCCRLCATDRAEIKRRCASSKAMPALALKLNMLVLASEVRIIPPSSAEPLGNTQPVGASGKPPFKLAPGAGAWSCSMLPPVLKCSSIWKLWLSFCTSGLGTATLFAFASPATMTSLSSTSKLHPKPLLLPTPSRNKGSDDDVILVEATGDFLVPASAGTSDSATTSAESAACTAARPAVGARGLQEKSC
mmetsp:Transcript_135253/g.432364  ORF Transcript_135253/g.432364 Transcript_135253/m.432364 type:complete len:205 (+) Transcript_135253:2413-3027(+)